MLKNSIKHHFHLFFHKEAIYQNQFPNKFKDLNSKRLRIEIYQILKLILKNLSGKTRIMPYSKVRHTYLALLLFNLLNRRPKFQKMEMKNRMKRVKEKFKIGRKMGLRWILVNILLLCNLRKCMVSLPQEIIMMPSNYNLKLSRNNLLSK